MTRDPARPDSPGSARREGASRNRTRASAIVRANLLGRPMGGERRLLHPRPRTPRRRHPGAQALLARSGAATHGPAGRGCVLHAHTPRGSRGLRHVEVLGAWPRPAAREAASPTSSPGVPIGAVDLVFEGPAPDLGRLAPIGAVADEPNVQMQEPTTRGPSHRGPCLPSRPPRRISTGSRLATEPGNGLPAPHRNARCGARPR